MESSSRIDEGKDWSLTESLALIQCLNDHRIELNITDENLFDDSYINNEIPVATWEKLSHHLKSCFGYKRSIDGIKSKFSKLSKKYTVKA